jgi:putative heme-binding domain-containing protein
MKGFEEAFQGRSLATLPDELVAAIDKSGSASLVLQVRQAKQEAVAEALAVVTNPTGDAAQRLAYVQIFGEVDLPQTVDALLGIVSGSAADDLKLASLAALTRYNELRIGAAVAADYAGCSKDVQASALALLASRAAWTMALLNAIEAGRIDAQSVPLDTVRLMTVHQDANVAALVRKHWPSVEGASSAEMQAAAVHLGEVLKAGNGDPYRGKVLYKQSCGKCHLLFGDGGRIGPDLTSFQRKDRMRVLINVVNPSAEIREGFESYMVVTTDGRVLSGFLFDQDNQVIVLRGADGQNVTIARDQIDEMTRQQKSLMPEGLLKELTDDQVRDLFAYLQTSQPLNN